MCQLHVSLLIRNLQRLYLVDRQTYNLDNASMGHMCIVRFCKVKARLQNTGNEELETEIPDVSTTTGGGAYRAVTR